MLELLVANEEHLRDIGINPWAVGGIAIGIFTVAVLLVTAFGKGREHN